jgi:FkbM family methyltransferase
MLSTHTKIRIAGVLSRTVRAARSLAGRNSKEVEVVRNGLKWRLDLEQGIDLAIYLLGAFERTTVNAYRKIVKQGDTVLDIGANVGAHTLHLARLVGDQGAVIAYEPTVYAVSKLRQNLALNPGLVQRVTIAQIMLTDSDDRIPEREIYASWPLITQKHLHAAHRGQLKSTEGCTALKLDSHLHGLKLKKVDFIKMDVDGFECHVLGGATATLENCQPTILMELSPYLYSEHTRSLDDLLSLMTRAGYSIYRLDHRSELPMDSRRIHAMVPFGRGINVIARARGNSETLGFAGLRRLA